MEKETRGTSKVLSKLQKSVEDGNYYEAEQMYKTLYARYSQNDQPSILNLRKDTSPKRK